MELQLKFLALPEEKDYTRICSRMKSIKSKQQPVFVFHWKQSQEW